jgi:hypothetical protein
VAAPTATPTPVAETVAPAAPAPTAEAVAPTASATEEKPSSERANDILAMIRNRQS